MPIAWTVHYRIWARVYIDNNQGLIWTWVCTQVYCQTSMHEVVQYQPDRHQKDLFLKCAGLHTWMAPMVMTHELAPLT